MLSNHEIVLVFLTLKTLKDQLFKQVDCNFTNDFSGPKSSRKFSGLSRNRPQAVKADISFSEETRSRYSFFLTLVVSWCFYFQISMNVKPPECVARSVATQRGASNALALRDTSWILTAENAVPVVCMHLFCVPVLTSSWLFTSSFWNERESVYKRLETRSFLLM